MDKFESEVEAEWGQRFEELCRGKVTDAKYTSVKSVCLACGLHFSVATWYPRRHDAKTLYCPQCGVRGKKLVWFETVPGFIFQTIPGNAELLEIKNDATVGVSFVQGRRRVEVLK